MLELKNVTKKFASVVAVDTVSFKVEKGEVVGFLGPNGAGKSTTMKMIASLLEPTEGDVLLDGVSVSEDPLAIKKRLGFMPENNPLYPDMLVCEYLDFMASLRGIKEKKKEVIEKAITNTGLEEVYYKQIGDLSKGYKQRTGLAAAILHEPDILILDEPTEGLDPNQRVSIRELVKKLGESSTVIISSHVLQEITATCERVIIINEGKIVADNTVKQLMKEADDKDMVTLGAVGLKNPDALLDIKGVEKIEVKKKDEDRVIVELEVADSVEDIGLVLFETATRKGWKINELHKVDRSLEDVFRSLTGVKK